MAPTKSGSGSSSAAKGGGGGGGGGGGTGGGASPPLQPLLNSQRRLYKSTYRPLTPPPPKQNGNGPPPPPPGNVLAKMALLRGLDVQPAELTQLASAQHATGTKPSATKPKKAAKSSAVKVTAKAKTSAAPMTPSLLDIAQGLASGAAINPLKTYGPALADMSTQELVTFGQSVAKLRSSLAAEAQTTLAQAQASPKNKTALAQLKRIAAVLPPITSAPTTQAVAAAQANNLPAILQQRATMASSSTQAFGYNAQDESVGWLDLERLEMYPAGVEHGELVHSVPLAPNQTVNITHREWTVTTTTYESLVSDSLEGFSETGVTDKTDLAQTVDTEAKHTSSLDVNGSVSATYNGGAYSVTASTAVNYNQTNESSQSLKDSIAHSIATTRNASTRAKKEHKQSFRVSSVAGAEDLAVSIITNPSATNAMRVDYFQLLRKWQVDLIRYGVRMTYDIVIPNVGLDLITRSLEIQAIDEMLTTSTYSFDLAVAAVTPDKWLDLSQAYGVALDPPPAATVPIALYKGLDVAGATTVTGDIEIDVPDGYQFQDGTFTGECHVHVGASNTVQFESFVSGIQKPHPGSPNDIAWAVPLASFFQGHTGALIIPYGYLNSDSGSLTITATASLTTATLNAWQLKSWAALRDADQAAYQQRLQAAKDRKTYLQDQISQFDALTLRKMEREEIMRWVLRWLLGPAFDLMPQHLKNLFVPYPPYTGTPPPGLQMAYPDVSLLSLDDWTAVKSFGEFIKYIHDAVEWENVLFFAYPYFWDHSANWPLKRFLLHPDPIHREFLRSGAMRVVLTIRPGFEKSFAMLQQKGDPTLPPDPNIPYVSVAGDIQDFAMTNYDGIPPANPDHNVRPLLYPLQQRAWADMQPIIKAIEDYATAHNGAYPPSLSALPPPTAPNPPLNFTDPWGNPYHYKMPGDHGNYDLVCYGADGIPDEQQTNPVKQADPLNADITNYAEGSIVARWYEYTPTSAMDISINTVLPTVVVPA